MDKKQFKPQRNRFSIEEDLYLLREVVGHNPFEDFRHWRSICENLQHISGKDFTIRAIKDHVEHLVQLHIKQDISNLRKSGTEEQYDEKERLLREVRGLWTEFKDHKVSKKPKNIDAQRVKGEVASEDDVSREYANGYFIDPDNMSEESVPLSSSVMVPSSTLGNYHSAQIRKVHNALENSTLQKCERSIKERELKLQEKKLELEERRLKLDEEKFLLDKEERQKRLEMEMRERENNLTMLQQQQNVISYFLNNFNRPVQ